MNFLNPFFLIGALAVSIPVVIHLINLRRPQKLRFSTLAFFEELKKSTIRRIRIKQYLLLALRVAAILMLAFALARPLLSPSLGGTADTNKPRLIGFLIDNSPSMSRIGAKGPFIEQARNLARTVVRNATSDDRFLVSLTNPSEIGTQVVGSSRALELINEVEVSKTGNNIAEALRLMKNRFANLAMDHAIIYLVTDGQKSQLNSLKEFKNADGGETSKIGLHVVRLGSVNQSNIAVSDIELKSRMLSKGNPVVLQVEIKNFGSAEAANQFVSVELDERMVGQYEVNLKPNESRELLFEIIPPKVGDIQGKIVIEGDEVTFDNERYFVLGIPQKRSVLLVNNDTETESDFISYLKPALEAAKQSNTQIEFVETRPEAVDQSNWLQHDVIILDGLEEIPEYWFTDLQRFVQEGNGVLFFPSEKGNIQNYNDFLGLFNAGRFTGIRGEYGTFNPVGELGELVEGHPVLDGIFVKEEDEKIRIDLPELFYYYQFKKGTTTGSYTILRSSLNEDILIEQRFGDGKILISTLGADPGWSNFPVNPLFAPIYYRSVLYASSTEQGGLSEHILGSEFSWRGALPNESVELSLNEVTYRPDVQGIPQGIKIVYEGEDWKPGVLYIKADGQTRKVAVNQRIPESDFESLSNQELENLLNNVITVTGIVDIDEISDRNVANALRSAGMGKEIWHWFIWLALVFLIAESLVSKLYKAESIT